MTRLRWALGAALAVIGLVACGRALGTYIEHHLVLGSATVLLLGVIDVTGFLSLALARRRLAVELDALAASPPRGSLYEGRRARLEEIQKSGGRPNVAVLADASAADEMGRAYLGRYLVAVTVLVGLVGTFAGLMETLRGVAPLLRDDKLSTLALVAAPLAGLDVTFGASIVGILVTLALSLVQGDLVIAEEQALARLEERTAHTLLPSLFPPQASAEERAVRELSSLRAELSTFLERGAEAAGQRVAHVAAAHVERLVREVRGAVEASVERTARHVEAGLLGTAATVERMLGPVLAAERERLETLRAAVEESATRAAAAGDRTAQAIARAGAETLASLAVTLASLERTESVLLAATRESTTTLAAESAAAVRRTDETMRAMTSAQAEHAERLLAAHEAVARKAEDALRSLVAQQAAHGGRLVETQVAETGRLVAAHVAQTDRLVETQVTQAGLLVNAHVAQAGRIVETHVAQAGLLVDAHVAQAGLLVDAHVAQAGRVVAAQAEQAARFVGEQAALLSKTAEALCETIRTSVGGEGRRLGEAAALLAASAADLARAATEIGGPLNLLAPELSAVAREVALLAAQGGADEQAATLDELLRLGEGVDRLEALFRLARGGEVMARGGEAEEA